MNMNDQIRGRSLYLFSNQIVLWLFYDADAKHNNNLCPPYNRLVYRENFSFFYDIKTFCYMFSGSLLPSFYNVHTFPLLSLYLILSLVPPIVWCFIPITM